MKTKSIQLELTACATVFNLFGESGDDGTREIAEMARQAQLAREAREWQERMQRKLSKCPGFIGCNPPGEQTPGKVTVQPGAADDAVDFLKRRFHVGPVGWQKGIGIAIEILPRHKGVSSAAARRRFMLIEQFQFAFQRSASSGRSEQ
jgi:hypothetical protein